jgi:hypothetical protein
MGTAAGDGVNAYWGAGRDNLRIFYGAHNIPDQAYNGQTAGNNNIGSSRVATVPTTFNSYATNTTAKVSWFQINIQPGGWNQTKWLPMFDATAENLTFKTKGGGANTAYIPGNRIDNCQVNLITEIAGETPAAQYAITFDENVREPLVTQIGTSTGVDWTSTAGSVVCDWGQGVNDDGRQPNGGGAVTKSWVVTVDGSGNTLSTAVIELP